MSKEFTEAAASYFGINPERLADSTLTSNAEGLTLHLKIRLTDDDMIGIGRRMEERRKEPTELRGRIDAVCDSMESQALYQSKINALDSLINAASVGLPTQGCSFAQQASGIPPLASFYAKQDTSDYRRDGTANTSTAQVADAAAHMYFKDDTGTWHPDKSPIKGHP